MCAPGKLPRKAFSETPDAYLYKQRGKGPSFVCRWRTGNLQGDSSRSGGHRILSSQLSLRMEFAVKSSSIGDPDCSANDLKRVSLASQENSSQDCPKVNS